MTEFHFISGLPRSGSTLLAAILKQNPRISTGMSSPLASVYRGLEGAMGRGNETAVFITDEQRERMLRGVFESFYSCCDLVLDNNRLWLSKLPALETLFPGAKVIVTVRALGWIIDSFERIYRRNPLEPSGLYGFDTGSTVYSRVGAIASGNGVVGWSLNALREAMAGEQRSKLCLVEYDDLCAKPQRTLQRIYEFLGLTPFDHDFENVAFSASEFDRNLGARGLHDVAGKVEVRKRQTVLPPDVFQRFDNDQFWRLRRG